MPQERNNAAEPERGNPAPALFGTLARARNFAELGGQLALWLVLTLLILAAATLPFWSAAQYRNYILDLATLVLLSALGGMSFNLLGGYAGQISFGQAAFFGISAYAFALLLQKLALNPLAAMFLAGGVSAVVCVPVGLILFRLRGAYFALSMLAFAEITRLIAQEWTSLTNGAAGLLFSPSFSDKATSYWVLLIIVIGSIVATSLLVRSKPGAYFLAIREDQGAAEALGIDSTRYKLIAFIVSAFMMGLAGAFYASYFAYLEPNVVFSSVNFSLNVIIVTLIGGMGRLLGPVVGAAILVLTTELFVHAFGQGNVLMSGLLLIFFMLFMPEGLLGKVQKEIDHRRSLRRQF
jgi:branched-chain amino acid transport system permease protein